MQQYLISLLIFAPVAAAFICLFYPKEKPSLLRYTALGVSILQLFAVSVMATGFSPSSGLQFIEQQPWITLDLGAWGILQAEYFVAVDGLSFPLIFLSVAIMLIATISSWTITRNEKGYFILLLILNGSIIGSFAALDFLLFYLFFEFMLIPMFFLIAIWGGTRREYASMKFFLYTLLGSILILIVMIGLYLSVQDPTASGRIVHTFNLMHMTDMTTYVSQSIFDPNNPFVIGAYPARYWAFLLLFIGFAIKLPMVPFHTWLPDAHVEAPTPISVILAALLLKIGGYGLARIAFPVFPEAGVHFSWLVGVMGVVSIIYGALNAMACKDLKRLIAYSSVSHMGFVLLGLASVTAEGITGAVYQMVSHGILSAMLFLIAGVIHDRTHERTISLYSGLSGRMKAYTAIVLIAFFASMGLPGFSGFIGEIMIFLGAFKSNSANGLLHESLAIVATLGLILGAAYFLWTIQRMFLGPFHVKGTIDAAQLYDLDRREYIMLIPLAIAAVFFGIFPQVLINFIEPFAQSFAALVLEKSRNLTLNP